MPQISATLTQETKDRVQELSKKNKRTFSETVEMLLAFAVKEKTRVRKSKSEDDGLQ